MAKPPSGARGRSSTPIGERTWVIRTQRVAVIGALVLVVLVALAVPARSYVSRARRDSGPRCPT